MDLQKIVLSQYMLLNNEPTLKNISTDTGIQITRIFRLFNGATMKLSEYQIFQQRVREKMGLDDSLETIALDCSLKLSPSAIKEIETFLKRKIEIWKIKQSAEEKTKTAKQLTA